MASGEGMTPLAGRPVWITALAILETRDRPSWRRSKRSNLGHWRRRSPSYRGFRKRVCSGLYAAALPTSILTIRSSSRCIDVFRQPEGAKVALVACARSLVFDLVALDES